MEIRPLAAKLKPLGMRGSTQEYFTEFEQLVTLAHYGLNEEFVLNILQQNARKDFIQNVYTSGNIPEPYMEWKERLLGLNKSSRPPAPATKPKLNPSPNMQPVPFKRDSTGITYGGHECTNERKVLVETLGTFQTEMVREHSFVTAGKRKKSKEVCRFVKEDPQLFLKHVQDSTPETSFVADST
ncbi:hypothetical protein BD414DRAFT_511125 [Trametes punicea]|nr:hypothetical protein BD414DRAFT_511125 [Trametes punicea]